MTVHLSGTIALTGGYIQFVNGFTIDTSSTITFDLVRSDASSSVETGSTFFANDTSSRFRILTSGTYALNGTATDNVDMYDTVTLDSNSYDEYRMGTANKFVPQIRLRDRIRKRREV